MKQNLLLFCLVAGGLTLFVNGCGKSENPPPAAPAAQSATPPPGPTAAASNLSVTSNLATQAVNAAAASAETAKSTAATATDAASKTTAPTAPASSNPQGLLAQAKTSLADLSQDQVTQGLQAALAKGVQIAVDRLGQDGGFLKNLNVKIPMPDKLQKVATALRAMKQDKLADDFVATMNHAAEQAVPAAGSVFADAIKQMTPADAKSILSGPNDAATRYFQKTAQTNLYSKFYPIVQQATAKTGVTAAYKSVLEKANAGQSLGGLGSVLGGSLLGKESIDIDAYVTDKALDGLFKMVADEEQRIRQSPVARTTDVLQKVFGALPH